MNIFVLMKRTFDTEEQIVVSDDKVDESGAEFIINPYDEYAIEEAILLKDEHGGDVTVVTVGDEEAEKELRTALAMGADKGVLIDREEVEELDQAGIALILSTYLSEQEYDLILCGNVAVDGGSGQVGPRVAERLGIAQVTTATKITIEERKATIRRDVEGDEEEVEVELPVLVTAQQGLNEPRYPSLPGIMKAKKKPLEVVDLEDLELDEDHLELKTRNVEVFLPPKKEAGEMIDGEPAEQVKKLISALKI
ncbi:MULTISPECIES: electron transfer flavoprotein subunit beta/FixA family protein [Alteribacter]|uniref:Electron transfer flavoprotein subunit beta n=1 Tax=Alteribacter keqinensis TaxID=2483800 RepID=A0A3M7TMP4_9BACI|nr:MULTISPECIES: electron transfer flavoprotein subunit beta/FixA family protein [Alteribacter]MBM7096672.1 electron transfer flavoprotein subunit beta/FixA family protein [Alteribacter salitolerans]RNA66223.1 electron transfer flavoprotein subunit beta/FixA family protein [Alteribacter keqinensis]